MLLSLIEDAAAVAISGHVRPDGDCVGAALALASYLKDNRPDITVDVYLEPFSENFMFMKGAEAVHHQPEEKTYDLFFSLDASNAERLGDFLPLYTAAARHIVIDHHITNTGFGDMNFIDADSSSTCELLYTLMDERKISLETAECLYLGIVHDTGVFKHSNTHERSMVIAGKCLKMGVDAAKIIDGTFYRKTFKQNKALGYALEKAELLCGGGLICSSISYEERIRQGLEPRDLDSIIDQLRVTADTEAALFIYGLKEDLQKCSMRSNGSANVAETAQKFGGGGHVKAAGCDVPGSMESVKEAVIAELKNQIDSLQSTIGKEL